jgi:hypothetical protein
MRKSIMLIVGFAALALVSHQAAAVKLSSEQVKTVCGNKLQSSGGVDYCVKKCGLNQEHSCDFSCYKGSCQGLCTTCGVKARILPHPYSNRVVRAAMVMPVSTYRAHRPTYCEWCYASCPPGWGGWLCRVHCQSRGGCQPPIVRHP